MKIELEDDLKNWSKYAKVYDPIKCASIDGTDCEPHDRAVIRAINAAYRPNRFVKGRPECTIFVSRLNHETSKDTMKEIFSKYGKLKRFRMVKDIVTGMPKGYAFVEYEDEQSAEEAYRLANKLVVDGSIIFVDFECERLLKGWKPRRLGGGFAGKKESGQLRFGGRDRPFKKPIALELKEKEEKRQREKERRSREDHRRRDKSRDRLKRKSPLRNENRAFSHQKDRKNSASRNRGKPPLSPKHRKRDDSPPRKLSKLCSPPTENGKQLRTPAEKDNKPNSQTSSSQEISRCGIIGNEFSRENTSRKTPITEKVKDRADKRAKQTSPSREQTKHREDAEHKAALRKHLKDPTKENSLLEKSEDFSTLVAGDNNSPSRQNRKPKSPTNRYYETSPSRDRNTPRSPLERDIHYYSPKRKFGREETNGKHSFVAKENSRSQSPLYRGVKYNTKGENWRSHVRRESPPRREQNYRLERESNRRRSPATERHRPQSSPERSKLQRLSPKPSSRASPASTPYFAPYKNTAIERGRSPFKSRDRHSPGRRSPLRYNSPLEQDISSLRPLSDDDSKIYHSTGSDRRRSSPSRDYDRRYKNERHSPTREGEDAFRVKEEPFLYTDENLLPNHQPYPPDIHFRQHSPPRVEFRQPSHSYHEPPRDYIPSNRNIPEHHPSTTGGFLPPIDFDRSRDARHFYSSRDVQQSATDYTKYHPSAEEVERQPYPHSRGEGDRYDSRKFEELPWDEKTPHCDYPPPRGGRRFDNSRPPRGGARGGRRGRGRY